MAIPSKMPLICFCQGQPEVAKVHPCNPIDPRNAAETFSPHGIKVALHIRRGNIFRRQFLKCELILFGSRWRFWPCY
jgi:hypothetical protein